MNLNADLDTEEVENIYSNAYDGPQLCNYKPARCPRDQVQTRTRKNDGHRGEIGLWCQSK